MISILYLDSSVLCKEWARRIHAGLWDVDSALYHTTKFMLYTTCGTSDGSSLRSGPSKRRTSLMYEVPCINIAREMESRIFSGQRYAFNEYVRHVRSALNACVRQRTPVDRWKKNAR